MYLTLGGAKNPGLACGALVGVGERYGEAGSRQSDVMLLKVRASLQRLCPMLRVMV